MFKDDPDDVADWYSYAQRRIQSAKSERDIRRLISLLDAHQFLELPEMKQCNLINLYADKLSEIGAD